MTARQRNIFGMLCGLIPEILFGFSFLCTKKLSDDLDVMSLLSWRFLFALIGMSIPLLCRWVHLGVTRQNLKDLLLLGLLVPVVYFIGETIGIQRTTSVESSIFIASIPVATLLLSSLSTRSMPSKWESWGVVIALIGVIGCSVVKGLESSFNLVGYLGLLTAVLAYPFFLLVATRLKNVSEFTRTYMMTLEGAVIFTILAIIRNAAGYGVGMQTFLEYPFTAWPHLYPILYLALGCSVCGFFLFNIGVTLIGATRTVVFAGVVPLVAILAGITLLGEPFSYQQGVFSALVIIGITITNLHPKINA